MKMDPVTAANETWARAQKNRGGKFKWESYLQTKVGKRGKETGRYAPLWSD